MPSSISSSEGPGNGTGRVRQTAADRPGVAQPVPVRPIPPQPWGRILLVAAVLLALMLGGWEAYWRSFGAAPGFSNGYGLWAMQRRRIDTGEGDATVLLGASRVYYDIDLSIWQQLDGHRPIQLAFEGTSPLVYLEDLADDPQFVGRALVGVAPGLFFSGYGFQDGGVKYLRKESPSQRIGQWLSMHLIEPYWAFDDPDFALPTVLARQPWPARPGRRWFSDVRRLGTHEADRNAHLWDKVANDPEYRQLSRGIWHEGFVPAKDDPSAEVRRKGAMKQIQRFAAAVAKLQARGVKVLFVRLPSDGEYLEHENRTYPRAQSWDALLAATGAPGIHFEDYPELQGYYLPEWSHMTHPEAKRFTAALHGIITSKFWVPEATAHAAAATP
ncbi:MAG TPA: hypothetical protein VIY54_00810 [Steroidobacteraceae bacterium]